MYRFSLSLIGLILLPLLAASQYAEDWQVPQDYSSYGYLYYDFTGDGFPELIQPYANTVTAYDGADEYSEVWSLAAPEHESLTIWDQYALGGNEQLVLLLGANLTESIDFQLTAYHPLATSATWTSDQRPGQLSYADVADLDDDPAMELVFGYNQYLDGSESYASRFLVLDAGTGNVEYESPVFDFYMVGPYAGDVDGDGTGEILINLYDTSELTSTQHVFSFTGSGVTSRGALLPDEIELQPNYPNPFNPSTIIPLQLARPATVEIQVVNSNGQRVKRILSGELSAGQHQFRWDGRNSGGARVATGMYFIEVVTDGHRVSRPMVLLK